MSQLTAPRQPPEPSARERLIEQHMPLARSLAHRYRHAREPLADLEQVAYLALVKAVDRFDPERGTAFSSYAVPFILGAIKRHFRDCAWPVHVPRGPKDLATTLDKLAGEPEDGTGRQPTAAELARRAGATVEQVLEAREAWQARSCVALDEPLHDEDPESARTVDRLAHEDPGFAYALERHSLDRALATLDDRRRVAIELYFRADRTQADIAGLLGCSQMHVSRLIREGLSRLEPELAGEMAAR